LYNFGFRGKAMSNVFQRFGNHCSCHLQGECVLGLEWLEVLYRPGSGWRVACVGRDWLNSCLHSIMSLRFHLTGRGRSVSSFVVKSPFYLKFCVSFCLFDSVSLSSTLPPSFCLSLHCGSCWLSETQDCHQRHEKDYGSTVVAYIYVPPTSTFSNSVFCPQSVFMCFVWFSE
jgi:hypothetical protein